MIREPLADLEARLARVWSALAECRDQLIRNSNVTVPVIGMDRFEVELLARANAYRIAVNMLAPVFAALDGREVVDAEPVERDHHSRPVDPATWTAEEILRNEG